MAVTEDPQTRLDEQVIESPALETALEERDKRRNALREQRKQFKQADDQARALAAEFLSADEGVVRVGRFRITKSHVAPRTVAFETEPTTRIRFSVVDK